jgi:tRNA-(ms[2]io[6]A)-hydroxylase
MRALVEGRRPTAVSIMAPVAPVVPVVLAAVRPILDRAMAHPPKKPDRDPVVPAGGRPTMAAPPMIYLRAHLSPTKDLAPRKSARLKHDKPTAFGRVKMSGMPEADLPLRYATPAHWAEHVLRSPLELLNDHAHLERKAATNALELLNRWPEPNPPENWVTAMTAISRDEIEHLSTVTRLLARRGGRLTRQHGNPYASGLRSLVRKGEGPAELVDRLMVSALIEARSCERFRLLADQLRAASSDPELAKLYHALWASEHGHYRTFIQLAERIQPETEVARRWDQLLDAEASLIVSQPTGARMHSGVER